MKRIYIFSAAAAAILIIAAFLVFTPLKSHKPAANKEAASIPKEEEAIFSEAEAFLQEGRLLEAKGSYRKLLGQYPASALIQKANARIEDLNMKLLFSPVITGDSAVYEVKAGDTLAKIAKEYGTTVELIMKSNGLKGTIIRPGMKLKVSKAKYSILVDKSQNILILKSDGEVLKTYTVSTGANNSTPIGNFEVVVKLIDPTWYKAGAVAQPGSPENILGTRWLGISLERYGIHGTTDESTLGRQITDGCVRMKNADVEELYTIVPVATQVAIID